MATKLKLYSYFRSSASFRVRMALHWKNLPFEYIPVHLLRGGGEQNQAAFRQINPMGHVPALDHDGFLISESMAILMYLDEVFPNRPLFPREPRAKAQVLQICELVNSGIQPLQNLKVIKELETGFHFDKSESDRFVRHWIRDGLRNLENILSATAGSFCYGGELTAADCFSLPQAVTALRFNVDLSEFPIFHRLYVSGTQLEVFKKSKPDAQPDFHAV